MTVAQLVGAVALWVMFAAVILVAVVVLIGFVGNVLAGMRETELGCRRRGNRCPACDYPLRGNRSGRCPECGRRTGSDRPIGAGDRPTEQRLAASEHLDVMTTADAVALMNAEDATAAAAVAAERANVAATIELVVTAFRAGGRLIYVGAGTSGRLGVVDASECPPTFSTDPEMVQAIMAGGGGAVFRSVEGAEDDAVAGGAAVDAKQAGPADVVMGIAASGTTPFVWGALRRARERGATTVFLACVPPTPGEPTVDVQIRPITGPEVLTGSTRLKAGTATKLVLNQVTTVAMVQLGKTYGNLMVDLRASNAKLRDRGARIVAELTGLEPATAAALLAGAEGQVKVAVVMGRRQTSADDAKRLLAACDGRLREALVAG